MSVNSQTNRLINENSLYLLQHAYNPVEWYPWGEEAFEKAKRENKPVLDTAFVIDGIYPKYPTLQK